MKRKPKNKTIFGLSPARLKALRERFDRHKSQIAALNWLSEGSVTANHPGTWRWTRKVKSKTVSVALSAEQADAFRQAIQNHRILENLIRKMRSITQTVLLNTLPSPPRRSPGKQPKSSLTSRQPKGRMPTKSKIGFKNP